MDTIFGWSMSGRPLDFTEAAIMGADFAYRYVAQTQLFRDDQQAEVSTMFMVESFSDDRPLRQFETMVFLDGDYLRGFVPTGEARRDLVDGIMGDIFGYKPKWLTFEEALAGHLRHVNWLRAGGFHVGLPPAP